MKLGEQKAKYFQQYKEKLEKHSQYLQANTVDNLLGVTKVNRDKPKTIAFQQRTKDQIQKHLRSLFTRNQADSPYANNLQRQVNLQLQDRPLQRSLVRGLTVRSETPRASDSQTRITNSPQRVTQSRFIEQNPSGLTKNRIFSMISGQFSQWGPARSVAAITAKTLFKNSTPNSQRMIHKSDVKPSVDTTMKIVQKSPKKLRITQQSAKQSGHRRNLTTETDSQVLELLQSLSQINTHNIQRSATFTRSCYNSGSMTARESVSQFPSPRDSMTSIQEIHEPTEKPKQTKLAKPKSVGQTLLQALSTPKKAQKPGQTLSNKDFPLNPFNNPTALQEYLNHWNPINQFERDTLRDFLYNRWINSVVEKRTLQVDYERDDKVLPEIIKEEILRKQSIRAHYLQIVYGQNTNSDSTEIITPSSSPKHKQSLFFKQYKDADQARNVTESVTEYMSFKRKKYAQGLSLSKPKADCYEQQEWNMIVKKDEDDLAQFDPFYQRKIKIKRAKQKLKFYLLKCRKFQIDLENVAQFIKSHSLSSFENIGAFAFIQHLKSEKYSECTKLLMYNKNLINDFNYLGETPLHIAVRRNNIMMLQYILSHNPDMECQNFVGQTPLQLAVDLEHNEIVKLLLLCSANPWNCLSRIRDIKIACLSWVKLKCPLIYQKRQETYQAFKERVFNELQIYILSPRSDKLLLSTIYLDHL